MIRQFIAILMAAVFIAGCASTSDNRDDTFTNQINSSPEIVEIDQDLERLEQNTASLEKEYDIIQKTVVASTRFEGEQSDKSEQLSIYVNENNAIIVDDKPLSKNEFASYIDKKLPAMCTPTPTLKLHNRADYDIAASLLEMIYARGCANVIFEQ